MRALSGAGTITAVNSYLEGRPQPLRRDISILVAQLAARHGITPDGASWTRTRKPPR